MASILELFWKQKRYERRSFTRNLIFSPFKSIRRKVARLRINLLLNNKLIDQCSAKLFWGQKMKVALPEQVSSALYLNGYFEESVTIALIKFLKPGMTFIDAGAHYGYFSLLAAALVGKQGKVYSFEPTPGSFQILSKNTDSVSQISVHSQALWSEKTELEFQDYGVQYSAYNTFFCARLPEKAQLYLKPALLRASTETIDNFVSQHQIVPDLIKIDAENAEQKILDGMKNTIKKYKPKITLETGDYGNKTIKDREIIQGLMDQGYTPLEYKGGNFVPHVLRNNYGYDNLLFICDKDKSMIDRRLTKKTIQSLLKKEDPVILEIGAHHGEDSIQLLDTGKNARLYCFEPDPRCIKKFKENIHDSRCLLVEAAVSDKDGWTNLHLSGGWPQKKWHPFQKQWDHSSTIQTPVSRSRQYPWLIFNKQVRVKMVSLNSWCKENQIGLIDFIWADVQGAERNLISGADQALKNTKYFYTEYGETSVYPEALTRSETIETMHKLGFSILDDFSDTGERGNLLFVNSTYSSFCN